MLREWIRAYDDINASPKGSRKDRRRTTAKESKMEQELYELFSSKYLYSFL